MENTMIPNTTVSNGGLADISQRPTEVDREKLLSDLKTIMCDAETLIKQTANLSLDSYALASAGIQNQLKQIRQQLTYRKDVIQTKVRETAEASATYVRANPAKSISYAVGAGVVLGLILSRRIPSIRLPDTLRNKFLGD